MRATRVGRWCAVSTSIINPVWRNARSALRPTVGLPTPMNGRFAKPTGPSISSAAMCAHEARRGTILSEWRSLWPAGFITVQLPGELTEWLTQRADAIAEADDLAEI